MPELVNPARHTGRPTILTRDGKPWAVVAPVSALAHLAGAPPEGSEDVADASAAVEVLT